MPKIRYFIYTTKFNLSDILKAISKKMGSLLLLIALILFLPNSSKASTQKNGQEIFIQHCSACHVNGGNIIRRGKNLKLSTLKRFDLDNAESIAKISREGVGIMSGYSKVLEEGEDELVAKWILEQAQKAWFQG